ncbi:helix-turn-helix domain-containing protein [Kitasatospora kifunensis]|uniref:Helix-turn-helix domain-containing protein n=1 Tax=Kitasatospora kifunensis TaxID=58351 RepID=A0A7W7QZ60_KITKI|nr:helix-turn-helix domain-containing protein [Kitasatospora kifunensis]MBB4922295.1 hypothetical protein [Kitasatospora kifunensis]
MDTIAAAKQAGVTVATIRTWCRRGAITATKTGRRWVIDATSLAYRINLPKLLRKAKVIFSVETLTAIGGQLWEKNGMCRVYINNWTELAGLELSYYNSGNISAAAYRGEGISNSQASKILGSIEKVWFDAADGKLRFRYGYGESRIASREQVWQNIVAGIRAAITAL